MSELQVIKQDIHEIIVRDWRLNRHIHHDPQSHNYPAPLAPQIVTTGHGSVGLPLNQGNVGCCTADALCAALNCSPDYSGTPCTQENALQLYTRETTDEGKPFPAYDPGGSGLAVCRAAKEMGWISSYAHTFNLENALCALVLRPVIFGVNWYSSFDYPNANGGVEIRPGAFIRGGHEICAYALNAETEIVWFWQSWGRMWGNNGEFWMSFDTLDRLLSEQGDCTVPIVNVNTTRKSLQ